MPKGGAREGAGRPKIDPENGLKMVSVRLSLDYIQSIEKAEGKSFVEKLRNIIDFYVENHK